MNTNLIARTYLVIALSLLMSCSTERNDPYLKSATEPAPPATPALPASKHPGSKPDTVGVTGPHRSASHRHRGMSGEDQSEGSTGSAMGAE